MWPDFEPRGRRFLPINVLCCCVPALSTSAVFAHVGCVRQGRGLQKDVAKERTERETQWKIKTKQSGATVCLVFAVIIMILFVFLLFSVWFCLLCLLLCFYCLSCGGPGATFLVLFVGLFVLCYESVFNTSLSSFTDPYPIYQSLYLHTRH